MKLTVLGCGDAFGNGGRSNTSFAISNNDGEYALVDCGATTLVRLKQEDISIDSISTIIITHFHGDHYGGIPFLLISALFEKPRSKPLTIVGPKGIEERVKSLQEAMYPGTCEEFSTLSLNFVEYNTAEELALNEMKIEAFEVSHSPKSNPHGIRLKWGNKVFAFSGDTAMTYNLVSIAKGADLFICECNFLKGTHVGHLSYDELIKLKGEFDCNQVWLSHMNEEVINSDAIQLDRLSDGLTIDF